ncbi:MAG: RHS repeat-associated core domain-containing protein [Parvularcula sp.]|jgi:RHS repeat-associated protein|nr:RHS repeat-associated core domain-containing protein [Parvularcula sp.]
MTLLRTVKAGLLGLATMGLVLSYAPESALAQSSGKNKKQTEEQQPAEQPDPSEPTDPDAPLPIPTEPNPDEDGFSVAPPPDITIDQLPREDIDSRLETHGNDLFGDAVDPYTGSLTFRHVDVSIPGNNSLPVTIVRQRAQASDHYAANKAFGDWILQTPNIARLVARPSTYGTPVAASWSADRCTTSKTEGPKYQEPPLTYGTNFNPDWVINESAYMNGIHMTIPGEGRKELLFDLYQSAFDQMSWPAGTEFATTDNWIVSCIDNIGDGSEGFIATSPQGHKYRFDHLVYRNATPLELGSRTLERSQAIMYATEVTDVHGNWVRYTYNGDKVTKIEGNDGRKIVINYNANDVVSTIVTTDTVGSGGGIGLNNRTWTYSYWNSTGSSAKFLTTVQLPDGRKWQFNSGSAATSSSLTGLQSMDLGSIKGRCTQPTVFLYLKHPDGMQGKFTLNERVRPYEGYSIDPIYGWCQSDPEYNDPTKHAYDYIFEVVALTEKRLMFPSAAIVGADPDLVWTYSYSGQTTNMTDPEGTRFEMLHGEGGFLDRQRVYQNGSTLVETMTQTVLYEDDIGLTVQHQDRNQYFGLEHMTSPQRVTSRRILRGTDEYSTFYDYNTAQGSHGYSWGSPTIITEDSTLSSTPTARITNVIYDHKAGPWILGRPQVISRNGKEFDRYVINNLGQVTQHWRFGAKVADYLYHGSGALNGRPSTVTTHVGDGSTRVTQYPTWHRGKPTEVREAVGTTDAATYRWTVDDNGWTMSYTDGRNSKTSYTYHPTGRLKSITRPSGFAGSTISALTSQLTQVSTRGSITTEVTYDGLLRPRVVKSYPNSGGGVTSYVRTDYDGLGRAVFQSLPHTASSGFVGTETTYDALGRVTQTRETFSNGGTTNYAYLSANRVRVTDPVNAVTTTTYSGYGSPDDGNPTFIEQPEGVRTAMAYDIYGNMLSANQYGNYGGHNENQWQYWSYDSRLRVCRAYTPEGGSTLYSYNNVDEMTAYVRGQSGTTGCASLPTSGRVSHSYDALGRLKKVDYADSTPDITYTYDDNSNVLTLNRANGANWSYAYNALNMLTDEDLSFDGQTYQSGYDYNTSGFMTRQSYPSGLIVDYAPNGLGQPTQARKVGSTAYASGITYHVNGMIAGWQGGNNTQLTTWLHASQQLNLEQYRQLSPSISHLIHTYSYTTRGQISFVNDMSAANMDRSYTYDGLGRLTAGSYTSWGAFDIEYDPLGNLRYQQFGAALTFVDIDNKNRVASLDSNMGVWGGSLGTPKVWTHDPRGNVTSIGRLNMGYDLSDQPTSVNQFGAGSLWYNKTYTGSYAYDGHKRRVKQVVDGKTIVSVYGQGGTLLHRHDKTANTRTDYVRVGEREVAWVTGSTAKYPLVDYLGTVRALTNSSGSIEYKDEFLPFGDDLPGADAGRDAPSFAGHIQDSATGLHYMQARFYEPASGRFLSIDPVGFSADAPQMFNRYSYAANDPVNMWDPDGMEVRVAMEKYGVHAYVRITDTDTGQSVISRGGPRDRMSPGGGSSGSSQNSSGASKGSSGGVGPIVGTVDPAADSIDTQIMAEQGTQPTLIGETTLGDDVTFNDAVASAESFSQNVNDANVPYRLTSQNSNSYAATQYEQLTGKEAPQGEGFLPGYDTDLCSRGVECE